MTQSQLGNISPQDHLVKEPRLAEVRTLAEGNALLPVFIADYNARFAKSPVNKKGSAPAIARWRRSGGRVCLERGAHPVPVADTAMRQGDLHSGAERPGQGGDRQAGDRDRPSRRPTEVAYSHLEQARAPLPARPLAAGSSSSAQCRVSRYGLTPAALSIRRTGWAYTDDVD